MKKFLKLKKTKKYQHYLIKNTPLFQKNYNKNLKKFYI